jgi:hypothetical protein
MTTPDDDNFDQLPIAYSPDNTILMHRDIHFGGSFDIMLDYYKSGGKGISKEIEVERIEELATLEKNTGHNLAAMMLSGAEADKIARARQAYQQLRDLYEIRNPKNRYPLLIADLILTEEEKAEKEIQAIVVEKGAIIPSLLVLLRNEDFYDPLYPGYGQAPALAAKCLGLIGDKRAIIALFEAISEGDFFNEDTILTALHAIGTPAKEFLLKVLHGLPLNQDNDHAAIALVCFKDDPEVQKTCLQMLCNIDLKKHPLLATHLVLACEEITDPSQRQQLLDLAKKASTPKNLQQDITAIAKAW